MSADIQEAKRRLPLKDLMTRLGFGDRAKKSARCPFHNDHNPSFGIFQIDGQWGFKCHACGAKGDSIDFLAQVKGIDVKEATKLFLEMAGVGAAPAQAAPPAKSAAKETPGTAVTPRPLGELLAAVRDTLRRYVSFQFIEQPTAIALWVLHTWTFEASYFTPYVHIFSAETSSGKSRLLEVLALLVNKPWKLDSGSTATIFRKIEADRPTVLYDEIDNVFRGNGKDDDTKDLRACLNSGFKWDGNFSRCVGQHANLEVKEFATFSPKALAGIGKVLSDTLSNRCIEIELLRRTRDENVERFREREAQTALAGLRAELEAWSQQPEVIEALRAARPALPDDLTDRQQDICEPLFALADMAGEAWPGIARAALVKLCKQGGDTVSIGIQLLLDVKRIFDEAGEDKLPTSDILDELVKIEDGGPWASWWEDALKHGKAQGAASRLAKLLKPYGIKARVIRVADGTPRGYERQDFEQAWKRWLPCPPEAATSATSATSEGENVAPSPNVALEAATNQEAATQLSLVERPNVAHVADVAHSGELRAEGLNSAENTGSVPAKVREWPRPGDKKAHELLVDLLDIMEPEVKTGLSPNARPDLHWGHDPEGRYYPAEYTSACNYVGHSRPNGQEAFEKLSALLWKIEAEVARETPLRSNVRGWEADTFPKEYLVARSYVDEEMARWEQEVLARE
jgi:hypothetical protein